MNVRRLIGLSVLLTLAGCRIEPSDPHPGMSDPRSNEQVIREAIAGDLGSQHRLCYRYHYGDEGVPRDDTQALRWCEIAANNGGPSAMALLGEIYYQGQGVPRDYAKALELYRAAASHGHPQGLFMVGYMYRDGKGVPADRAEAIAWLKRAQAAGHEHAATVLAKLGEAD
jgi:TPR repeat protein